jgi:uncharacterized MAPEG superfamily protein
MSKFRVPFGRGAPPSTDLLENPGTFAVPVLVAHVVGESNDMTVLGATLFLWARVAHALDYVAGVVCLRTVVFFVTWRSVSA